MPVVIAIAKQLAEVHPCGHSDGVEAHVMRWLRTSSDLHNRAASKDKNLHIVRCLPHVGLYDKPDPVGQGMSSSRRSQ